MDKCKRCDDTLEGNNIFIIILSTLNKVTFKRENMEFELCINCSDIIMNYLKEQLKKGMED